MADVYRQAAAVLQQMDSKQIGLRAALYDAARPPPKALARVYALLSKTLAMRPLLQQLLDQVGLTTAPTGPQAASTATTAAKAATMRDYLLLLMLRDLLLSPKGVEGGGQLRRELLAREAQLRSLFSATTTEAAPEAAAVAAIPRYLRVNRRLWDATAAAKFLRDNFPCIAWALLDPLLPCVVAVPAATARLLQQQPQHQNQQKKEPWQHQQEKSDAAGKVGREELPEQQQQEEEQQQQQQQQQQQSLLLHELVPRGFVSLQDRASCTAAAAAAVAEGDIVLEACAAPGSKTLHIIDMLGKRGHLIALERDAKRLAAMLRRLQQEAALRGPYLSPCCTHQYAACTSSSSSNSSDMDEFLRLAELASKQPLYFARSDEPCRSTEAATATPLTTATESAAGIAPAAASYNELAASLPLLLVEVRRADFAAVRGNVPPFCLAQKILLDPSCSGSGLPTHATAKTAVAIASAATPGATEVAAPAAVAVPEATKAAPKSASGAPAAVYSAAEDPPDLLHWSWEGWKAWSGGSSPSLSHVDVATMLTADCPPQGASIPSVLPPAQDEVRVARLAAVQQKLLLHALSAFPAVSLVCYSTCSVYVHENEAVLLSVGLHQQQRQEAVKDWRVSRPPLHPGWFPPSAAVAQMQLQLKNIANSCSSSRSGCSSSSRGCSRLKDALEAFSSLCVRASPHTHRCRGFFLATICRSVTPAAGGDGAAENKTAQVAARERGGSGKKKRLQKADKHPLNSGASMPSTKPRKRPKIRSCSKVGIRV